MDVRFRMRNMVWILFSSIAAFLLTGSVWLYRTYGVLSLAMSNESFRAGLRNKRTLFVRYVIFPTFIVLAASLLIHKILKDSVKRMMAYFMGGMTVVAVCVSAVVLDVGSYLGRQYRMSQEQWYDTDNLVVHALGGIDEVHYTNSKEALENSYEKGNRLFECDMIMTADGKLAACHDWEFWNRKVDLEGPGDGERGEIYVPTLDDFMNRKFLGKYTPLSGTDIMLFLKEHPDAYVITDTKYVEPDEIKKEFQELVKEAQESGCEPILDRFVVQLYHGYMYGIVQDIYPFPNCIFTLYAEGYKGEEDKMKEYAEFCVLYNVDVITMNAEYYHDELLDICNQHGIRLFVHTVNSQEEIAVFHEKGIGVYTDNVER